MGDITSFQGNLQLNVKRVRKVQEGEYDPKDYLPVSEKNIDENVLGTVWHHPLGEQPIL